MVALKYQPAIILRSVYGVDSLELIKSSGRPRKIDWNALAVDIQKHPDKLLRERAKEFGVRINVIWYVCQKLKISHKKNAPVPEAVKMLS